MEPGSGISNPKIWQNYEGNRQRLFKNVKFGLIFGLGKLRSLTYLEIKKLVRWPESM